MVMGCLHLLTNAFLVVENVVMEVLAFCDGIFLRIDVVLIREAFMVSAIDKTLL